LIAATEHVRTFLLMQPTMPTTHPGGDPRHTFLKPPEVIARYRCRGRRYAARSPVRRGGILALTWLLSRQNLGLLLDHGMLTAEVDNSTTSTWGNTVGNATYVWRTALGIRQDGSLVFVVGASLSAHGLATIARNVGAVRAIELDINASWTNFITYTHPGQGVAVPRMLTTGEQPNPYRYLQPSARDFVAVLAR